jgi:L,D-peptidoglycan transpeptidase YkuD (ErfK/YbiS/YcfS/YnhG family)
MVTSGGLYRWGIVVEHNWNAAPGQGSCIFIHIRAHSGAATSGCTAMSEPDLLRIIRWLDASKQPVLVQLPAEEYRRLQKGWGLP